RSLPSPLSYCASPTGGLMSQLNRETAFVSCSTRIQAPQKWLFSKLGPGLVTGASDDDPSGIATYSQVGAQFGYGMLWTLVFSYPLMAAMQEVSARIGRVTGGGIAANLRKKYPKWLLYSVVALMVA